MNIVRKGVLFVVVLAFLNIGLGSVFLGVMTGGKFFPILSLLVFLLFLVSLKEMTTFDSQWLDLITILFVFWSGYALLLAIFSNVPHKVFPEIWALLLVLALARCLIPLVVTHELDNVVWRAMLFTAFLLIAAGVIEFFFNWRFPQSRYDSDMLDTGIPTGYFYNENNYAFYLVFAFSWLCSAGAYSNGWVMRAIYSLAGLLAGWLIAQTFSRASLVLFIATYALHSCFTLRRSSNVRKLFGLTFFVVVVVGIFSVLTLYEDELQVLSELESLQSGEGSRVALAMNSWYFFEESYGFGVGGGNSEWWFANRYIHATWGIINAHNWWLELLVEYGFLIAGAYSILVLMVTIKVTKIALSNDAKPIDVGLAVNWLTFPLAVAGPSSIMYLWVHWVMLLVSVLRIIQYKRMMDENRINCSHNNFPLGNRQ